MKKLFTYLTFAIALLGMGVTAQAGGVKYGEQKAVYHINDINHANGALRNINNHLNATGDENTEVIVVMHSAGAFTVVEGAEDDAGRTFTGRVAELADRGVKFQICANTIRGKKIPKEKISMHAEVVPSGVAQLAHLQQLGYVYIKP